MALLGFMVMVLTILSMDLRISQATSRFTLDKPSSTADYFQQWMIQFSRVYPNEAEKQRRFEIFKNNLKYIDYFNSQGNHGFKLGVNQFADQVFSDTHTRLKGVNITSPSGVAYETIPSPYWNIMSNVDDYSVIDWRLKGAVTGVRNQGIHCGSAWAFAVVAAVEGLSKIGRGELIELSKQQLLDCDVDFNRNQGSCKEGTMTKAYNFIVENGIASEEEYPYEFQEGSCKFWARPSTLIRGFGFVDQNNELALMEAVLRQPVSVAVVSNISSFNLYTGGVFDDPDCRVTPLTPLDHAMTLVGFGTTPQGIKYWIAKNSWGEGWGESGYMRIRRDVLWSEGMCGLARFPSYPVPTTVSSGRLIITQSESLQVLFLLFLSFIIIIYLGGFVRVRL